MSYNSCLRCFRRSSTNAFIARPTKRPVEHRTTDSDLIAAVAKRTLIDNGTNVVLPSFPRLNGGRAAASPRVLPSIGGGGEADRARQRSPYQPKERRPNGPRRIPDR